MADKRMFNSKLTGKGLESTVSEEQAKVMVESQGASYLFLVKAHVGPYVTNEDGSKQVTLVNDIAEIVPAEHTQAIQEFLNALIRERPDPSGASPIPWGGDSPTAAEAAGAIPRGEEWDGNPDTAPENTGTCDYPDCTLASEHDGDHSPAEETPEAEEPEADKNVVAFSGKSKG